MNFAELRFWELFVGVCAVVLVGRTILRRFDLCPAQYDKWGLLFIGLFLLLCVSRLTFLIFLLVAIGTYVGLKWIVRFHARAPRRYMFVLVPLQLLPLFYYKYANFVGNDVAGLNIDSLRHLMIPVGISFYTFQKVAFVVDTLAFKQPLPRFLDYMNFAAFFPQIVAGPIERRKDLLPQMEGFRFTWRPRNLDEGVSWIALGFYFKCCLADNLAVFFAPSSNTNAYLIWQNNLLFGLRIYYDFAGYSLIGLGLAKCLGIRLTLNFASPYCAASPVELWRRWHITLSQWFRDYVYVPLGGGRAKWWAANVLIVFLVSGVWHGAGWNFVLWGALHGGFLIVNRLLAPHVPTPAWLGWLLTMLGTFFAWLCFYESRATALAEKLLSLFTPSAYSAERLREALQGSSAHQLVMLCLLLLTSITLLFEWQSLRKCQEPYALLRRPAVLLILVVLTVILSPGKTNGFIYFAF